MQFLGGFSVLDAKGAVGLAERGLMLHAVEYMLIVALPVFFLLFFFAWRYRAGNKKAAYTPDWVNSPLEELIWWAVPFEIVLILGALTWGSTHTLDPRKPLSAEPPLVVEVVAQDSQWLFIYPEQKVVSNNYLQIPVDQPVRFDVTSDAPMNSLWIPSLGGQIYAMTGMVNSLNLIANSQGTYDGSSANYSGVHFVKMRFKVDVVSKQAFADWVAGVTASSTPAYVLAEPELFEKIIRKYTQTYVGDTHH